MSIDLTNRPIFVLGVTFRSGTTAIQRALSATQEVFIWGEPFHPQSLNFVTDLVDSNARLDARPGGTVRTLASQELGKTWVAALNPDTDALESALQVFFNRLYRPPVNATPATRWGFKDLAMTDRTIMAMMAVFPQACGVVAVRDPVAAWQSYLRKVTSEGRHRGFLMPRNEGWLGVDPEKFATAWNRRSLELSYLTREHTWPVVRFEELEEDPIATVGMLLPALEMGVALGSLERATEALGKRIVGHVGRAGSPQESTQEMDSTVLRLTEEGRALWQY